MIFSSIPSPYNDVFKLRQYGGVYDGIKGKTQIYDGCGLNNCTCAAWGLTALYENDINCKIGCGNRKNNMPYDAGSWFYLNRDIYKTSDTPVEGAVICYTNHVAFVNEVKANGDIVVFESGYGSSNKNGIWKTTLKRNNDYDHGAIYGTYLGFLLPKERELNEDITTKDAIHKMALDVIAGMYGNGLTRKNKIYAAIQTEVNNILSK